MSEPSVSSGWIPTQSGTALDEHWRRYLRALEPALATMYSDQQPAMGEQSPVPSLT